MRIALATVMVPFVRGGAESHVSELERALIGAGHDTVTIALPFKWYPPDRILDHMLACRLFDLTEASGVPIDLVIGMKFPAYLVPHPNKVMWILHQHRQAYDLWDNAEASDLKLHPNGRQICTAIRRADDVLIPEANKVYANSKNVASRLHRYNGIEAHALYHPPPNATLFRSGDAADYLFYPSRISPLKRQSLVIRAIAKTHSSVRVQFAGAPEYPPYADELKTLARNLRVEDRVQWVGSISEAQKIDMYARCIGVIYPPYDEDYGYVTLEAMLASKPVITCMDSGGPNEFVADGMTGYVVDPTDEALAAAMDTVWENRGASSTMGRAGRALYESLGISWETVTRALLS